MASKKAENKAPSKALYKEQNKAPNKTSNNVLNKAPNKTLKDVPNKAPNKASKNTSNKAKDNSSNKASNKASNNTPNKVSNKAPNKASNKAGKKAQTKSSENEDIPEIISDLFHNPVKLLDLIPDTIRKFFPKSIEQQIPKRVISLLANVPKELILKERASDVFRATTEYIRTAGYPMALFSCPLLPLLLLSLAKVKINPTVKNQVRNEYDYVVVGGGAAGATVASRLSERPCVSVLLLEAGKEAPWLTDVPMLSPVFFRSDIDFNYHTVPQKNIAKGQINNQILFTSGKVLGGSTILNAMIAIRGNKKDYDKWSSMGATGWSFNEVQPYFIKLENDTIPDFLSDGMHGVGGPMTIERTQYDSPYKEPLKQAAVELGYKLVDTNGPTQTGFFDFEATMRNGQRCSTAKAYLIPADERKNLDIVVKAVVIKVILNGNQATGVQFSFNGAIRTVNAKKEVILSAGAIASPQLLMLSGIGPEDHLKKMGIKTVANLPVGDNMQDHVATPLMFTFNVAKVSPEVVTLLNPLNHLDYIERRTNYWAGTYGGPLLAFLNNAGPNPSEDYPDFELYFASGPTFLMKRLFNLKPHLYRKVFAPHLLTPAYLCISQLLRPDSRGTVRLSSVNPLDPPLIDPNYYSQPKDLQTVVTGMKMCRKLCGTAAMKAIGCQELSNTYPGCENIAKNTDQYLQCMAQTFGMTIYHKCGTAKMGNPSDNTTVVDPELRVKGINGLRVVDASIMPSISSGNTQIPVMMIAEKASDMIKKNIPCQDIPGVLKGVRSTTPGGNVKLQKGQTNRKNEKQSLRGSEKTMSGKLSTADMTHKRSVQGPDPASQGEPGGDITQKRNVQGSRLGSQGKSGEVDMIENQNEQGSDPGSQDMPDGVDMIENQNERCPNPGPQDMPDGVGMTQNQQGPNINLGIQGTLDPKSVPSPNGVQGAQNNASLKLTNAPESKPPHPGVKPALSASNQPSSVGNQPSASASNQPAPSEN